jgi:hypothetical protein
VLQLVHKGKRNYCAELTDHANFLQDVQDWMAAGIRRKLAPSQGEKQMGPYLFSVIPFTAGAVDVHTGLRHEINVDWDALNLFKVRGFYPHPLPPHVAPLDPADVAQTISYTDIEMRFETNYVLVHEKQSALSFTNLRWLIGLQELCILNKNVRAICGPSRTPWVRLYDGTVETLLERAKELPKGSMGTKVVLARELTRLVHPEQRQNDPEAMGDLFMLYTRLQEKDSRLLDAIQVAVRRSLAERDRPVSAGRKRMKANNNGAASAKTRPRDRHRR